MRADVSESGPDQALAPAPAREVFDARRAATVWSCLVSTSCGNSLASRAEGGIC